jgi:enoyl-CoA hydratase/carnithine racemase
MPDHILTETDGHVALVRLNRPQALNALNSALMDELAGALEAFDADDGIRVVIITGNERAFAAGADIRRWPGRARSRCSRVAGSASGNASASSANR